MLNTDNFPYLIIDDANAHLFCSGGPQARATGLPGLAAAGRSPRFSRPAAGRPDDPAEPMARPHPGRAPPGKARSFPTSSSKRASQAKDQNGLGYCWVYGSTRAVEVQRAVQGLATLDLSPESVGGPCTHWRNQGGYASEAFEQLQNFGACESSFMDAPHSLHPNCWKPGWQANAAAARGGRLVRHPERRRRAIFDEVITCLLNRVPVAAGLDWWGHLVCFLDPIILPDGSVGVLFQNSWGVDWPTPGANGLACLTESRATPDGAAAPIVVTAE